MSKKAIKKLTCFQYMILLCIQNMFLLTVEKMILWGENVYGPPIIITACLWFGIFKKYRLCFISYKILAIWELFLGFYSLVTLIICIVKTYNPGANILATCIVQFLIGVSYAISAVILHTHQDYLLISRGKICKVSTKNKQSRKNQ